ncbi:uncharacterized protein [Physeter macrocephalus]|uniref:Uncharacterized protein n=1 Tax=Physeter macrocephalus TaxID=9755 RepID=A0A455AKC8_PHYMC|nr:uncharacterized protein LOC114483940 [Physeter catodon]|eukprot:XP_028336932.1 uncharacterized protein LOC114483940 [Physeter catodon]
MRSAGSAPCLLRKWPHRADTGRRGGVQPWGTRGMDLGARLLRGRHTLPENQPAGRLPLRSAERTSPWSPGLGVRLPVARGGGECEAVCAWRGAQRGWSGRAGREGLHLHRSEAPASRSGSPLPGQRPSRVSSVDHHRVLASLGSALRPRTRAAPAVTTALPTPVCTARPSSVCLGSKSPLHPLPPVSGRQLHLCPLLSEQVGSDAQSRKPCDSQREVATLRRRPTGQRELCALVHVDQGERPGYHVGSLGPIPRQPRFWNQVRAGGA